MNTLGTSAQVRRKAASRANKGLPWWLVVEPIISLRAWGVYRRFPRFSAEGWDVDDIKQAMLLRLVRKANRGASLLVLMELAWKVRVRLRRSPMDDTAEDVLDAEQIWHVSCRVASELGLSYGDRLQHLAYHPEDRIKHDAKLRYWLSVAHLTKNANHF